MKNKGNLIVISGPSGTGKGTVCKELLKAQPEIVFSISATTRKPRPGEVNGKDYWFLSKEEFQQMIAENRLLEWAEVYGNYYGTPKEYVQQQLDLGKNVILEIEIQGALKIKEKFPIEVHRAFSKRHYLEIMDKTVNKGETLLKLFEMEGINKENVIAFGDGWNDLEMLQLVGEGVAMGNADEELKRVVGRSCDTNDNNGIAKYLAKYL